LHAWRGYSTPLTASLDVIESRVKMHSTHKNGVSESVTASEVSRKTVLAQLDKILQSPQFRSSKRCSVFLRYVVEHADHNHTELLKERSLGVEVFERDPHYDTNQDPVVRSTAGEVRKRLAQYYVESGHTADVRISLPPGSYVPEIHRAADTIDLAALAPSARRKWIVPIGAALAALLAIPLLLTQRQTDLDRFWAPVIDPSSPVVLCVGQPRAYKFAPKTQNDLARWFENGGGRQDPPTELASIPISEIVPTWDRQISLVDAQALLPLFELLTRKGKKVQLQGGRAVSLTDFRGKPCVLVGAFNNDWTLRLTSELRFYFEHGLKDHTMVIRDRLNPGKSEWTGSNDWPPPANLTEDYAIVSRVFNPTTEQTIVSVAGATGYGTLAAGELLTNPAYFSQALQGAPRGWYTKNIQAVLSVKVMSGTAGPPKVIALHFW
jgi:hypothetical protein